MDDFGSLRNTEGAEVDGKREKTKVYQRKPSAWTLIWVCLWGGRFVSFAGVQITDMNAISLTESKHFCQLPVQGDYKTALLFWPKDHMLWLHFKERQNFKCICQLSTNTSSLCLIKHIVHIRGVHMVFDFTSQLTNDWRLKLQRHMKPSLVVRLKNGMTKRQICVSTCVSLSSSTQR